MGVFNRIVVVVLLIILLAAAVLLAVLPIETVSAVRRGLEGFSIFLAAAQTSYFWIYVVSRVALVVVALVGIGLLLWAELRRRRPRAVRIITAGGSNATVTTESVARRLSWHIDQLADVISVTPEVTASGRSVNVRLNLETRPEIDVPMKTDEVVGVAREVITERMGLQLGKIEVRIKHAPYQEEA